MKILIVCCFLISHQIVCGQTGIEGRWNTGKENTIIQITKVNDQWEGRTVSSDEKRLKLDLLVMRNLEKKNGHWKGEFYIFRIKKWANITLMPEEDELEVKVSYGLMSKQLTWQRE